MKKVLLLVSCACLCFSCVTIVYGATSDEVSASRERTLRSSKSSVASDLTVDDFAEYYDDLFKSSIICYWKDKEGRYSCILVKRSNMAPTLQRLQELQTNKACPVFLMAQIIAKKYQDMHWGTPDNDVYETSATIGELECYDIACSYQYLPTRNREIYSLLGLDATYERYYADSEQVYFRHDGFFEDEANPAFGLAGKYFTNLSNIYRWTTSGGEIRYGVTPENDYSISTPRHLRNMQSNASFKSDEMRRLAQAYYSVTNVEMNNLIVNIPLIDQVSNFNEEVANKYPESASTDISVYQELGLEESYRRHFGG